MSNKPYFVEDFFEVLLEQNISQYSMLSSENKKIFFELILNKFFEKANLSDELWKYVVDDYIGVHLPFIAKCSGTLIPQSSISGTIS